MRTVILIAALAAGVVSAAAQEQIEFPEACRTSAEMPMQHGGGAGQMMDHQREANEGMMMMDRYMTMGMMAEDPDVAFMCGMIAHHMGAIAMSEVELKYGDDEIAREMAQRIIEAQKAEIAEMTRWVEENAKK
jgi:uncharacterized protein (DUF305 family)